MAHDDDVAQHRLNSRFSRCYPAKNERNFHDFHFLRQQRENIEMMKAFRDAWRPKNHSQATKMSKMLSIEIRDFRDQMTNIFVIRCLTAHFQLNDCESHSQISNFDDKTLLISEKKRGSELFENMITGSLTEKLTYTNIEHRRSKT